MIFSNKFKTLFIIWIFVFILNVANYFEFLKIPFGIIYSLVNFSITLIFCLAIYKILKDKFLICRLILLALSFLGGFFTMYNYYGFIDENTLDFAILLCIIVLGLSLGIGIII